MSRLHTLNIAGRGPLRAPEGDEGAGAAAPVTPVAPAPQEPDKGFPDGTPVADMTADQRAAYWQDKARKHEDRVKALGVTPEQLTELRAKATRAEKLEYELASDKDKAVADAVRSAAEAADAKYRPALVDAEFRAAAAGRIEPEKLATILEPLDKSRFLTPDGNVDAAKVSAYVDGIAPGTGTSKTPLGPTTAGQGSRGGTPGAASVAAGRDLYRSMHPKK